MSTTTEYPMHVEGRLDPAWSGLVRHAVESLIGCELCVGGLESR